MVRVGLRLRRADQPRVPPRPSGNLARRPWLYATSFKGTARAITKVSGRGPRLFECFAPRRYDCADCACVGTTNTDPVPSPTAAATTACAAEFATFTACNGITPDGFWDGVDYATYTDCEGWQAANEFAEACNFDVTTCEEKIAFEYAECGFENYAALAQGLACDLDCSEHVAGTINYPAVAGYFNYESLEMATASEFGTIVLYAVASLYGVDDSRVRIRLHNLGDHVVARRRLAKAGRIAGSPAGSVEDGGQSEGLALQRALRSAAKGDRGESPRRRLTGATFEFYVTCESSGAAEDLIDDTTLSTLILHSEVPVPARYARLK